MQSEAPPSKIPKKDGFPLIGWIGIAFSVAFLFWFGHDIETRELGAVLNDVSIPWVALSAIVLLSEFWLRALRWQVLLQPIQTTRYRDLLDATLIGAAGNTLLPFRAGDIARAAVASGSTGVRMTTVLATNVMERVYDLFGLVFILLLTFLLLPEGLGNTPEDIQRIDKLALFGKIVAGGAVCGMLLFFALAKNPARAQRFVGWFTRFTPQGIRSKIDDLCNAFIQGLAATQSLHQMGRAILISLVLWFNLTLAVYLLFSAFGFGLPYAAACFVTVAIALAVVIPQGPGYLGPFQSVIAATITLWTTAEMDQEAKAFAIVFWGVSFVPVTVWGLLRLRQAGLSLKQIWSDLRSPTIE